MSPIYFFYGDPFFTELKLKTRKKEFANKYGKENIFQFSAKKFNTTEIVSAIWGGGLFTSKKMVIIQGLPQDTTSKFNEATKEQLNNFYEYFLANKQNISEDNLTIFVTSNPDKKTKRAKYFLEGGDEQIKGSEHKADKKSISNFIQSQLSEITLTSSQQELILSLCNENMYLVTNEINKIKAYIQAHPQVSLTEKMIVEIVSSSTAYDVRSFLDGIIFGGSAKSTEKLISFARADNNEFQFLGLLYRSIGGIIGLIDARKHGIQSSGDLAKYSKLPPFTVSRYLPKKPDIIAKQEYFKHIYHQLIEMDYKLKTGMLPPESFWPSIYGLFAS
ncbi:MAG: hypothetical protein WC004_04495 [Candidatus Absconditabacterales bacterium]